MNRRKFIIGGVSLVAAGSAALAVKSHGYQPQLPALLTRLEQLRGASLQSTTAWNASQVLQHLAQSVEGSIHGFAELKPAWFRASVGPIALAVFKARGAMSHPLTEPIPGAGALDAQVPTDAALDRLLAALQELQQLTQAHPHFAYGELSLQDSLAAHQLHIEQHLTALNVV